MADQAGALVAGVVAASECSLQFAAVTKPVGVADGEIARATVVVVAGQSVVIARVQVVVYRGVTDGRCCRRPDPWQAVVDAVVVDQAIDANREFVFCANAEAVGGGQAFLVQAATRAVVVGFGCHRIDAQARAVAGADVEVAGHAGVVETAQRRGDCVFIHGIGLFANLVHRTTGGATAKQHGRRAAQQFDAIAVESVALVEGWVAHAIHKNIARGS